MLRAPCSITLFNSYPENNKKWVIMEGEGDDIGGCNPTSSPSTSSNSLGNSTSSNRSTTTSSSDLVDDASSLSSSSHSNDGPLYELSELMSQLPIKRGLSKYFQGKSQSYTSLSNVRSIEDLAKKETPYQRKMKACKSYGGGLDAYRSYTLPRPTISKKVVSRGHSSSSLLSPPTRRGSFLGANRLPPIPVHKN
ncbi:hypothetical protein FNV43_RR06768 [Rhamnella rubrinervis]|uniref:Oxidative stress 3 n=1 Tax=Rhamnella rubrinervis TaxID=2594499 RepID=A0A8K0MLQ6_9ROSA|nr:hypothetical protein FNV43_RR06768 [Rhamnella rubrinervis]